MPKLTVAEEMDLAIKLAAKESGGKSPSREVAERLYESEAELVQQFAKEWVIEKLAALVRIERSKSRRAEDPRIAMQTALGFHRPLPKRIVLRSGEKLRMEQATMGQLKEHRAGVFKQERPALSDLDKAIELMSKYTAKNPKITLGEVLQMEAEKGRTKNQ